MSKSLCLTYEGLSVKVSITDTVTLDVLKDLAKKNLALDFEFDLLVYDEVFGKQLLLLSLVDLKDAQEVFVRRKTNIAIEKPSQSIGGQSPSINKRILGSVLIRTFKVPDFGERITRKLQCGTNLDRSDRSNMLSSLFSAIMPVTLYPTPTEYEHVTTQLLDAFPRLGDIGWDLAWASWKTSIVFHFQSSRKNRQEIKGLPEVQKRSIKKRKLSLVNEEMQGSNKPILKNVAMWGMENYLPARLTEDNDETIAEHLLFLQNEVKKKRPNFERVESSMKSTFSDRRREIVKEGLSIQSVIEKYKFLKEEEDILAEFTRLATLENNDCLENLITQGLKQLSKPLNQISRQYNFKDEITKDIVEKYRQQRTEDAVENLKIPFSVLVLLRLLQEKWQNIFVKEGADCPEGVEVFIAFEGDTLMDEGLSVHVDGTIIKCSSLVKSICVFLALHFVFNIKYNRKVTKFLIYIEKFIAKITSNIGIPQAVVKTQVKILEALKIN